MLVGAALVLACGPPQPPLSSPPLPSGLEGMDPEVQQQFHAAHEQLQQLLADRTTGGEQLGTAFGRLGMVFHAYRHYRQARDCYLQAETLAPAAERWPYFLALAARARGETAAAESAARRTLALRHGYPPARLLIADGLFDRGKIEQAEQQYAAIIADDESFGDAWTGRARCALASGRPEAAVEYAREALAWSPKASPTHYLLAQAYSALGERQAAARHFQLLPPANLLLERGTAHDPLARELAAIKIGALEHTRKGARAFAEKSYQVSLAEMEQALAANPEMIHVRYAKAQILRELGRPTDARAELEQLLAQHPEHELSLNLLAVLLVEAGRLAEAKSYLVAAVAINPASATALASLATIDRLERRPLDAVDNYRRSLRLDPGDARNHFWLAATLALAGDASAAREALTRARTALPADRALRRLEEHLESGAVGAIDLDSLLRDDQPPNKL